MPWHDTASPKPSSRRRGRLRSRDSVAVVTRRLDEAQRRQLCPGTLHRCELKRMILTRTNTDCPPWAIISMPRLSLPWWLRPSSRAARVWRATRQGVLLGTNKPARASNPAPLAAMLTTVAINGVRPTPMLQGNTGSELEFPALDVDRLHRFGRSANRGAL